VCVCVGGGHVYPSPPSSISQKLFTLSGNHAAHLSFQYRGLSAPSEPSNLVLVMKTYIPAPFPERRPH